MTTTNINEAMTSVLEPLGAKISDDARAISLPTGRGIAWGPPEDIDASHPAAALACGCIRIAAEHADARTKINQDERLTDTAKAEDIAKLDASFKDRLDTAFAEVERHAASLEASYAEMTTPAALEPGDAVGALNDREVRDYLRSLPIAEQLGMVNNGSERLTDAVLRSPLPFPDPVQNMAQERRLENLEGSNERFRAVVQAVEAARWGLQVGRQAKDAFYSVPASKRVDPRLQVAS